MAKNVQVCCRFRPTNAKELEEKGTTICCEFPDEKSVKVKGMGKPFVFDHVFQPGTSQIEVFSRTAKPMVEALLAGYNVTLFAYGQTGSGKTHTMMGVASSPEHSGIIPRTVEELFKGIESADADMEFTLKLSYVEIYMEKVRDLLAPDNDNLRIRELNGDVWIEDVTELYVGSLEEVLDIMRQGETNRSIASTRMNEESSRSHSVFVLTLGQEKAGSKKSSKLILVDLAGSEKVRKTEAMGQTLKEAQHINKSLSALGNVINALTESHKHVPYRDSKLTRLLSSSLGGNSQTCLIVTASPSEFNVEETISTLRFGTRAKRIKNKPVINLELSVAQYKELLDQANKKIKAQENIIKQLEKELKTGARSEDSGKSPTTDEDGEDIESTDSEGKKKPADKSLLLTLQDQIMTLETAKQKMADELEKVQDQLTESQRVNTSYQEQSQLVDNLKSDLLKAEGKVALLNDQVGELTLFKSKVSLREQEFQMKIDQLKSLSTMSSSGKRGSFSRSDSISDLSVSASNLSRDVEDLLPSPVSMTLTPSAMGSFSMPDFHQNSSEAISPLGQGVKPPEGTKPERESSGGSIVENKVPASTVPTKPRSSSLSAKESSLASDSVADPSPTSPTPSEGQSPPPETPPPQPPTSSHSRKTSKPSLSLSVTKPPPSSSAPPTPAPPPTQPPGKHTSRPTHARKSSRGVDDRPNTDDWTPREKELQATNSRLLKDLQSKCEQHLKLSLAYSELLQVDYGDRQKQAWYHEQKDLQNHIAALARHAQYQKTLLKNRTDHISHLEHALHESNAAHREQLHRHEAAVETLTKELKKQQDMVEILTRERESHHGQKRLGPFASPRVVIPLRGGGVFHESSRARTSSAFFPSTSGGPPLETEVTPIRAKFASKEAELAPQEDVVVTFSPLGSSEADDGKEHLEHKPEAKQEVKQHVLVATSTPEKKRKASETLEFPISGLSTFEDDDDGPQIPAHLLQGALDKNDPTSPQRRSSLLQRIFKGNSPAILKTKFAKSASGSALQINPPDGKSGETTTSPPQLASPTSTKSQPGSAGTGAPPPTLVITGETRETREPPSPQRGISLYFRRKNPGS